MSWPEDADGDVLRGLVAHGFDFSRSHVVDFNVDFETWPPSHDALAELQSMFGAVELFAPTEEAEKGYAEFQVQGKISYELVTSVQRRATLAMTPFGGVCESWGVMQDAV